jgi:hypothetical protein
MDHLDWGRKPAAALWEALVQREMSDRVLVAPTVTADQPAADGH